MKLIVFFCLILIFVRATDEEVDIDNMTEAEYKNYLMRQSEEGLNDDNSDNAEANEPIAVTE
jgi:hypothetical protein